jgi:hypothetical protein
MISYILIIIGIACLIQVLTENEHDRVTLIPLIIGIACVFTGLWQLLEGN